MKVILLVGVWVAVFWGAAAAEVVERIVAVVNEEVISMSEVEQMAKVIQSQPGMKMPTGSGKDLQRQLLDALILQKLAKVEAKRRGITVSEKEVEKALEQFKKRNNIADDETLSRMLSKNGLTLESFKQQLADQMTHERLISVVAGSKVVVTSEEVRRFYEQEYPKTSGKEIHLKMINMPLPPGASETQKQELRKKAELILQEHRQGASLNALAQKHGVMIQDLGFVAARDLDPELAQFLSSVKPGETAPVETLEGFRLVQVVDRRDGGRSLSFEEAEPQIRAMLQRRKMEETFQDWIKNQKDRAHIKIMM
ncbi:MAG: SurA N-terminal domain-containing protein [Thermodesulfobacteriota bacterium]